MSEPARRLAARSLADGERVAGRYLVEALLGEGGHGEVYRVRDELDAGRTLALKLARIDSDQRSLETLRGEFALLASLRHPNLARVHDFGELGAELAYFTQDLVSGVPLGEAGVRLDDPRAIGIWAQLCQALEYLHARGILHRDIKPSNILVNLATRQLTLLDFGIARALGAGDTQLIGTPAYTPPEALFGSPLDARSDVYSLGATFYRCACGRPPFTGTSIEILALHVAQAAPRLPEASAPPAVAELIARMLAKDAAARPASAREVLEQLAEAVGVELEPEPPEQLASYVLSARFVGGDEIAARLRAHCFVPDPRAEVMLLTGASGSGKSRLLAEVRQRAQLAGRGWIQVGVRATWAHKTVLHSIARAIVDERVVTALDDDDRRELSLVLPELRRRGERIAPPLDPERAQELRVRALGRAIQARFEQAPGVLALDDLHFAEHDSLELFRRVILAAQAEGAECVFVLASRPAQPIDELAEAVGAARVAVDEIGPDSTRELVGSMFGQPDLLRGSELGEALERAPHTAQHVQESLRLALDCGAIVRRCGAWHVVGPIPALPLAEVLARRFALLPNDRRAAALAIAVIGGSAAAPDVAAITGQRASATGAALKHLVRAGSVAEELDARGRTIYVMHDRLREVVLSATPEAAKRRAHQRAAARLVRTANDDFRVLMDAAELYALAGDLGRALKIVGQSAKLAEQAGHPDRAAAAVEREIRWRQALGEPCIAAWLRRFDLCALAGMRQPADEALSRLAELALEATPAQRIAISVRRSRVALERRELEAARSHAESALPEARALGDDRLLSELHWTLARADELYGTMDRALESFQRAAQHAERGADRTLEAKAWLGASLAALFLGSSAQSKAFAERSLAAAKSARAGAAMSDALRCLGNAAREVLDLRRARNLYERAVRAAQASGSAESEAKAFNNLGTLYPWLGQVAEAETALLRALRLKERLGLTASALLTRMNLGQAYLAFGRLDEARAQFTAIIESGAQAEPTVFALAHSNSGDLALLEQRFEAALEHYRVAHRMNRERGNANADSHALAGLLRAHLMRDQPADLEQAEAVLGQLAELQAGGDLAETRRRYFISRALVQDRRGEIASALESVRHTLPIDQARRQSFSDVLCSELEAEWLEAVLLARTGSAEARAAAGRAQRSLSKLCRHIREPAKRRIFLAAHPLHATIGAKRLDTPPGWSWVAEWRPAPAVTSGSSASEPGASGA